MTNNASETPSSAAPTPPTAQRAVQSKRRTKPRRKTRRRDGDDSDAASVDDGSEAPTDTKPASKPKDKGKPAPKSVFPDVNSTTPAAWADVEDKGEEITFDEFMTASSAPTPGNSRGGSLAAGRGRARGGGRAPRELTEEEKQRVEARTKEKKERLKAKRKDNKEKRKADASAGAVAPINSGPTETSVNSVDASLAASTSAITLDDLPTQAPPSTSPPDALSDPVNNNDNTKRPPHAHDAKFAPRGGNFWMHDQRHYEAGNGEGSFWRGRGAPRGMMPRGSFRGGPRGGRGRGFGPFAPGQRYSRGPAVPPLADGHRMAEMDKLELELSNTDSPLRRSAPAADGRWGHEGFEEHVATEDHYRTNRLPRGRGRGRGFFVPRGGAIPRPFHQHATLPTPEASPDRAPKPMAEGTVTQPDIEALLDDSGAVMVRLPGDTTAVEVEARPPSQPIEPSSTFAPSFTPSNPSPVPYVASDSGSMSSGYLPPGVILPGAVPNGEFYGGMPPNFGPPGSFYPARNLPPSQSYTPEPAGYLPHHHHHHQRSSFSGPGFYPNAPAGRSGSPLNPYASPYFAQPMLQKVAIAQAETGTPKSPTSDHTDNVVTPEGYMHQGYYPQGYNPYAGTMGPDGQGGVYYAQGYWPQPAPYDQSYGYEGEYAAY